jgi:CRISPR-associated protein Csm1
MEHTMDDHVLNAALAGLLHDIGKFAQRADIGLSEEWDQEVKSRLYGTGYEHALYSGDFAKLYVPEAFNPLLSAAYHHAPKTELDRLIQLADRLAAGERDVDRTRHPKQLQSIFCRVKLNDQTSSPAKRFYPLAALALKDTVLFARDAEEKAVVADLYKALWDGIERRVEWRGFATEAEELQTTLTSEAEKLAYLENMLALMQRYTWCIPSAYYHSVPDVSLYDHSRMTAALAVCLIDCQPDQIARWLDGHDQDRPAALLLGGDLSGVQSFIYTLSSKKAAQTLRGRSFYLQLLTEAVLRFVLRHLDIPYTNVIYSGGGHFYLLAPVSAKERLAGIQKAVTEILLTHHGTQLYLALGCAEVPTNGFQVEEFSKHWNAMHQDLGRAKQRRYLELGNDLYSQVFQPKEHGGNKERLCSVCGEEREDAVVLEGGAEGERICRLCSSFYTQIGSKLAKHRFVTLGLHAPQPSKQGTAFDALRAFGLSVNFGKAEFETSPERIVVWSLDDPPEKIEVWPAPQRDVPVTRAVRYTVNLVPYWQGDREAKEVFECLPPALKQDEEERPRLDRPKTFTHLQYQAQGIPRLGVVRMDVDDLGEIFRRGLKNEKGENIATLSRIAALSFQMSLFFEGWVKKLCDDVNRRAGRELIYAVYAGGDDVFLIGPWDQMPELASRIAHDFTEYAADNADVHVSGGLAFIHGKYPVYQAADDAKDALDKAKDVDEQKDAFCFLDQEWKWRDFDGVADKFKRLIKIVGEANDKEIKGGGLGGPQAILQVLQQLARDEADTAKRLKGRPVWGPWMWRGVYQLERMAEREKKNKELFKAIEDIRNDLSGNEYRDIAQWGAAARWAQLWLRKTPSSEQKQKTDDIVAA